MTGPVAFTSYYYDESNDDGFQWKFGCERCSTEYRSSFKQNMFSRGRGALRVLRDLFGDRVGALHKASSAAENYSHTWGASASSTRDKAFAAAIEEVQKDFRLCGGVWVLGVRSDLLERAGRAVHAVLPARRSPDCAGAGGGPGRTDPAGRP